MPQETKRLVYFIFESSSDFEFCRKPMVQIVFNYTVPSLFLLINPAFPLNIRHRMDVQITSILSP